MLNGGGWSLEDIGQIRADEELKEIPPLEKIPSSDAFRGLASVQVRKRWPLRSSKGKQKATQTGYEI
jgi:hypothetical protein